MIQSERIHSPWKTGVRCSVSGQARSESRNDCQALRGIAGKISALPAASASGPAGPAAFSAAEKVPRPGGRPGHDSFQITSKYDPAVPDSHRQRPNLMYTLRSGAIPGEEIQQRRFRMAIQAHLAELERKHRTLESELHEALVHLSTDDLHISELKRRKLMVRDEIERLKHSAGETLH
jgi:hypothetical protein